LDKREADLKEREKAQADREKIITDREAAVIKKEAGLKSREEAVKAAELVYKNAWKRAEKIKTAAMKLFSQFYDKIAALNGGKEVVAFIKRFDNISQTPPGSPIRTPVPGHTQIKSQGSSGARTSR